METFRDKTGQMNLNYRKSIIVGSKMLKVAAIYFKNIRYTDFSCAGEFVASINKIKK
jgi:hypothetical protein